MTTRQQILQNAFNAIEKEDYAYVSILPAFQAMYPTSHHVLYGHVAMVQSPELRGGRVTKLIHVRTVLGFWSFKDDGISLTGQASLSIRNREKPSELICLYEPPSILETLPKLDALIEKAERSDVVLIKTAECGCGPNGPCARHAESDLPRTGIAVRPGVYHVAPNDGDERAVSPPHDLDVMSGQAIAYDRSLGLYRDEVG